MTFCVIGEDARQKHLAKLLTERGIEVYSSDKALSSDVVVFPTPLRRESETFYSFVKQDFNGVVFAGAVSNEEFNAAKNINLYDYTTDESFALLNALPSAEGALYCIMGKQKKVLQGLTVIILGYGRIAKLLATMLFNLGCKVKVVARRPESRADAESVGFSSHTIEDMPCLIADADVFVNTVPSQLVGQEILSRARPDIHLLDLASLPGGFIKEEAQQLGLAIEWAPGLPALYSPYTAAEYVLRAIDSYLGGLTLRTPQ